jgi:hypothetical protein
MIKQCSWDFVRPNAERVEPGQLVVSELGG